MEKAVVGGFAAGLAGAILWWLRQSPQQPPDAQEPARQEPNAEADQAEARSSSARHLIENAERRASASSSSSTTSTPGHQASADPFYGIVHMLKCATTAEDCLRTLNVLCKLATLRENQRRLVECSAIPVLVNQLSPRQDPRVRALAARCLLCFCLAPEDQLRICKSGGVVKIIRLLEDCLRQHDACALLSPPSDPDSAELSALSSLSSGTALSPAAAAAAAAASASSSAFPSSSSPSSTGSSSRRRRVRRGRSQSAAAAGDLLSASSSFSSPSSASPAPSSRRVLSIYSPLCDSESTAASISPSASLSQATSSASSATAALSGPSPARWSPTSSLPLDIRSSSVTASRSSTSALGGSAAMSGASSAPASSGGIGVLASPVLASAVEQSGSSLPFPSAAALLQLDTDALVSSLSSSGSAEIDALALDELDEANTRDAENEDALPDTHIDMGMISSSRSASSLVGRSQNERSAEGAFLVGPSRSQDAIVNQRSTLTDPRLVLEALPDALQCLMNLSFSGAGDRLIRNAGGIATLIKLTGHKQVPSSERLRALKTLVNLSNSANNRSEIYAEGGLGLALELLANEREDDTMTMRVVQLLSNMAQRDGSPPRITSALNCISPLYQLLESSNNETLCEEVLVCLQSVFEHADEDVFLSPVSNHIHGTRILLRGVRSRNMDIQARSLECLQLLLTRGDSYGIGKRREMVTQAMPSVEALLTHSSTQVREQAITLISTVLSAERGGL
eukprot:CAMPEP_0174237492 /NCGR_PEP_ID=MMETSP0417-20130205/8396_1 /TAXON_ID=242541 /ORGANISM="Mayorella sp, Strain BSH-02190019" /LENGTH=740 /DNA_ID=CAMNT_0015316255 /DNA_START=140 /DNA_END=2362 /DNA_ORIENTATION=+